ncbi:UbiA prenyltransferase family [Aspergillus parasiticus]|uniref:UbiA prenyltransferase family n=1 Tax=Aspergillus parasiticus TaxID=5067 RepID=A0A5N6DIJ5_ASPPA|nr:UbiA prenyltransferase family [Aspergillus parasiticus]
MTPSLSLCCLCNMYCVDIPNQTTSVAEDRANKPNRPIPSRLLSLRGAYIHWAFSWTLSPVMTWIFVGAWAAFDFMWLEMWILFCYVYPKPSPWFFWNEFAAIANFAISRLVNICVYQGVPELSVGVGLDIIVLCWVMSTIHLQEFHDIQGDRISGRRTLPLVLGPVGRTRLRIATAIFICCGGMWVLASAFGFVDFYLTHVLPLTSLLHCSRP